MVDVKEVSRVWCGRIGRDRLGMCRVTRRPYGKGGKKDLFRIEVSSRTSLQETFLKEFESMR